MAARPFWRRISVHRVNAILYLAIACLALLYWPELRWAAKELPNYLSGHIGSPIERKMYRQARRLIQSGDELDEARRLLEGAIAIDPTCEAVYWLGEYYFATEQYDEALGQFTRYIDLDPTTVRSYLRASVIHERDGRPELARDVVQRGLDYFTRNQERYWPRVHDGVPEKFNHKASEVYRDYYESVTKLEQEMRRLGGQATRPGARGAP